MSIVIWNPTNEELKGQYSGRTFFFPSGAKIKVDDNAGNHLLHNLGDRGLTSLEYECDEKQVEADAIQRNKDFKTRQVIEFNQRNESRKQTNFPYLSPTKEVKAYAIELGMGLYEPFTPRDPEREGMAILRAENSQLKNTLDDVLKKMDVLAKMVMKKQAPVATDFKMPDAAKGD